ncbi:MAG TPA: VCBS repeat-containing protein [Gemmatimonadaceae bacterium]|nr:VCBS repeat-containing protein [Gemmatimonadaceae bacterium]
MFHLSTRAALIRRGLGFLLFLAPVAGCRDLPTTPERIGPSGNGPAVLHGVLTVTIAGITSGTPHAAATRLGPSDASRSLVPVAAGSDEGIQLNALSASSFTKGVRGAGGQRYVSATFRVRNASTGAVPYTTPRTNLTLVAVGTSSSLGATPVAEMLRFDGTPASPSIAPSIVPTGGVSLNPVTGVMESAGPDVLQVFTEAELAAMSASPGVTNVFPYGFVVRNASSTSTRTLPANPDGGQLDGIVTFAFRLPLQATAAEDPFTISVTVQAVDDSETRITQSVEEQSPTGIAAFDTRATALSATTRRLLAGGTSTAVSGVARFCSVRTAGTAASPAGFLFPVSSGAPSFSPDPFATGPAFLPRTGAISATLSAAWPTPTSATFAVNGNQSGRAFLAGDYTGGGTTTISTPSGNWFAGEEVEVTLTDALACQSRVAKFRVASSPASGTFGPDLGTFDRMRSFSIAIADVNGDRKPDLLVANSSLSRVSVSMGVGDGTFGPAVQYGATYSVTPTLTFTLGDVNGDGRPDLLMANGQSPLREIRLNNGDGTFGPLISGPALYDEIGGVSGDLDGDGRLDVVWSANGAIDVRLGRGNGTFGTANLYTVAGMNLVALADLNGDGRLDIVLSPTTGDKTRIMLGAGDATFQPAVEYSTGLTASGATAVGDLNGDGKLDLAIRGRQGGISVMLGRGDGTFDSPLVHATGAPTNSSTLYGINMTLADINGDGHLDMISDSYQEVSLMLGNGDGTFISLIADGRASTALALADLNGDGRLDLVFAEGANLGVRVRLGQP